MPILTGVPVALFVGPSRSAALAVVEVVPFEPELVLLSVLLPHAATSSTLRPATAAARRQPPRRPAASVGSPMCPPGYLIDDPAGAHGAGTSSTTAVDIPPPAHIAATPVP